LRGGVRVRVDGELVRKSYTGQGDSEKLVEYSVSIEARRTKPEKSLGRKISKQRGEKGKKKT